tara:strand:+ start:1888 stop:2034 length:147 start_codon:yes stop_codon:yes gene_type:complete
MKAVGTNLIVDMNKIGVSETKGGLFLAENNEKIQDMLKVQFYQQGILL